MITYGFKVESKVQLVFINTTLLHNFQNKDCGITHLLFYSFSGVRMKQFTSATLDTIESVNMKLR